MRNERLEVKRVEGRVVARRRIDSAPVTELASEGLRELRRLLSLVDSRPIRARIEEVTKK